MVMGQWGMEGKNHQLQLFTLQPVCTVEIIWGKTCTLCHVYLFIFFLIDICLKWSVHVLWYYSYELKTVWCNHWQELRLRDEECEKLSKLRAQMEHEIDELTASLFMVSWLLLCRLTARLMQRRKKAPKQISENEMTYLTKYTSGSWFSTCV